jgi:hypothetical protein
MPRVNRDMQRRMAARRERERRRPSGERRYQFTTPEPRLEPDDEALVEEEDGQAEADKTVAAPAARPARTATGASVRGASRVTTRPFSAYKDEYAYVYGDLRRVAAVIGGLLLALVILYFVLPVLVH